MIAIPATPSGDLLPGAGRIPHLTDAAAATPSASSAATHGTAAKPKAFAALIETWLGEKSGAPAPDASDAAADSPASSADGSNGGDTQLRIFIGADAQPIPGIPGTDSQANADRIATARLRIADAIAAWRLGAHPAIDIAPNAASSASGSLSHDADAVGDAAAAADHVETNVSGDVPVDALLALTNTLPSVALDPMPIQIPIPGDEDVDTNGTETTGVDLASREGGREQIADASAPARGVAAGFMNPSALIDTGARINEVVGPLAHDKGRIATDQAPQPAESLAGQSTALDEALAQLDQVDASALEQAASSREAHQPRTGGAAVHARSLAAIAANGQTTAATATPVDASVQSVAGVGGGQDVQPATAVVDAESRPPTTVELAARRTELSNVPSIQFADPRDAADTGTADDSPRDGRHGAAARLAAAISASGEQHAGAALHESAPVFTVPATPAAQAQPTQAAPAAVAATAATTPQIEAQNIDRIVQSMQVGMKSGAMEATVHLRPDYLGEVTIQLRVDGTGVSAIVRTDAQNVRQWLASQEESIRSGLAEHGLELTRFVIDPDDQPSSQRDAHDEAERQRLAAFRRRQAATLAQRFDVTV